MSFRTAAIFTAIAALATPLSSHSAAAVDRHTIDIDARLSQGVLKRGESQSVYLRIGIRGIAGERREDRTPANIALVIDRSGSMGGRKIAKAREAAKMAINRLAGSDIVSVVMFDNKIDTIVRATRVADSDGIRFAIDRIKARGGTAIYAAIKEAARQVRRYQSPRRLNRIILMSDGLANVGPSKPYDFEELGRKLGGEGISVTTVGLGSGYKEDLMSQLATASDGNHAFARSAADLTRIFNGEFDDVLSVTAQELEIRIRTREGITPLRTLGRSSDISGNVTRMRLAQVYGTAEYSLQLELKVPAGIDAGQLDVADIEIDYVSTDGSRRNIKTTVSTIFSTDDAEVRASIDKRVMEPILELQARERSRQVIKYRDKGDVEKARKLLLDNAATLAQEQKRYGLKSERLDRLGANSRKAAASIADRSKWNASRKQLREDQSNSYSTKQRY